MNSEHNIRFYVALWFPQMVFFKVHQMAGQKAVFPITIFDTHLLTLSEQVMHGTLVKF